jgi:hypothetical protein
MGYYIQGPTNSKAARLIELGGEPFDWANTPFHSIPPNKVAVIVCYNGPFDAAGIAYDEREYKVFTDPKDKRKRQGYLLDKSVVKKECPPVAREWN